MTVEDINRMGAGSGSIQLGKITTYEDKKSANITPIPFPGQDAEETQGVDTLGVIAYINISGQMTGSFSDLQNRIYLIKNIMDGKQTSAQTFYSPFVCGKGSSSHKRRGNIGVCTSASGTTMNDTGALFSTWGIQAGDYLKNIRTGDVSTITSVSETALVTSGSIMTTGDAYAVTANIKIKVLDFNVRWELPALNYVYYDLSIMQVKE